MSTENKQKMFAQNLNATYYSCAKDKGREEDHITKVEYNFSHHIRGQKLLLKV